MTATRIKGFRLVTRDSERLTRFYVALGFDADDERPVDPAELDLLGIAGGGMRRPLRVGAATIDLDWFDRPGRRYPAATDAASVCFQHLALVTSDVPRAWNMAQASGATPITRGSPVTLPAGSGGVTAVKFRDPDGHPLELIHFPQGGDEPWHGNGLLGIDHSAVVATEMASSRAFYDSLGLARGDATLNHGPTQQALDGLDGARVDVVPMIPTDPTPHVELLHYRWPAGASCAPWTPNDVAATRIVWQGNDPELLRDPDGHLHQVER